MTQQEISLTNAPLKGVKLPTTQIEKEVTPGSVKAVKANTRRSDAFIFLSLDKLTVLPDFNVRVKSPEYMARVRAYADDMKENGFRIDKPISCYVERLDDGTERTIIADGHTRYESAQLAVSEGADISEVPVVLLPKSTSMDDLIVGLVTTNSGSPLSMLETAFVVKRLLGRGHSTAEISRKLHITSTAVDKHSVLAGAPKALQMMVAANQVAGSTVIGLIESVGAERAVKQLTEQLEKAQKAGKSRITAKHLPSMQFDRAVRRNAPQLYAAAATVKADPGYRHLSQSTREALDAMLTELENLRGTAGDKDSSAKDS